VKKNKVRNQRKRRQRRSQDWQDRNARNVQNRWVKAELPDGYTLCSRSYGVALYEDTPKVRNIPGHDGKASVRQDTRLGGFEDEGQAIAYAHEHAGTPLFEEFKKTWRTPARGDF